MEEHKVWIRGVNGRGSEVIEMLVALGAKNKGFCGYNREEFIYFINHDGYIDSIAPNCELGKIIIDNYRELKLPELWNDGDILVNNNNPTKFLVKSNAWTGHWDNHFKAYLSVNPTNINESPIAIFCNADYHKAYSEEVKRFHELLHKHGKDWDAKKKQVVDWKWEPKEDERYYYIDNDGEIVCDTWDGYDVDADRYNFGNCFTTREEAEVMVEKIKKLLNAKS